MTTASALIRKLGRVQKVEIYTSDTDHRRRLLRLNRKAIQARLAEPRGWAEAVRTELIRILNEEKRNAF